MNNEDIDKYVLGILRKPAVSFTADWNPDGPHGLSGFFGDNPERQFLYSDTIRFLGIDWWSYKTEFTAKLVQVKQDQDKERYVTVDTEWQPVGPVKETKPERWRRYGHKCLSLILSLIQSVKRNIKTGDPTNHLS